MDLFLGLRPWVLLRARGLTATLTSFVRPRFVSPRFLFPTHPPGARAFGEASDMSVPLALSCLGASLASVSKVCAAISGAKRVAGDFVS